MLAAIALFILVFFVLWAALYALLPAAWRRATALATRVARALLRRERLAAWYGRGVQRLRPLHPYRPLGVILATGFLVAGATGGAFMTLATRLQARSARVELIDQAVYQTAALFRSAGATAFFTGFTLLGTAIGLGIIVLAVSSVLIARGRKRWAAYLIVTSAGGWALNQGLKLVFTRARPDLAAALGRAHGYSFPSGHAMMSLVVFGALAYLVSRAYPSWRVRSASLSLAVCLTASVSVSRLYLGVHWMSDIVGGHAAGLLWLATTSGTCEVFRRTRILRAARARPGAPAAAAGRASDLEPAAHSRRRRMARVTPARMAVPESSSRALLGSPRSTTAPTAAITGTESCTIAARAALRWRSAAYQRV